MPALLLALCGLPIRSAAAQVDEDSGIWLMLLAQGRLGAADSQLADWRWWFDGQPRFGEDFDHPRQYLARPGVGYALGERTTAWAGYAWIRTEPTADTATTEHRAWQQLIWSPDLGPISVSSRTRLEQRWLEGFSETGWRARQFVKLSYPLTEGPGPALAVFDEVFYDLGDTRWGARTGFAQNRLFAGVDWRLDAAGRRIIEVGYLNQYIDRPGDNAMNHLLSINLLLTF